MNVEDCLVVVVDCFCFLQVVWIFDVSGIIGWVCFIEGLFKQIFVECVFFGGVWGVDFEIVDMICYCDFFFVCFSF